ncbi:FAD dependent oxidoreductase [Dacryopinax primogenitus]|uniref:FAD dependent oxidoreductase n=1 Tax=Dacryopinax primogenitus (strain DJM 731) TaxID=1858805 RepID=M5GGF3_DACPD|nr:FAD dependent oxidoreductase [Dacryopinax primogenitus]EJU05388.1 FAD dependent oxidoreductase [Dacryopinax primogenitus]
MSRSIVIIGGGIIGTSTAYYLTRHPAYNPANVAIHIVEASHIAAGSSGKGGGFLAEDWHQPYTASLGRLSFRLHEELAREYGGDQLWGYRRVKTLNLEINATGPASKKTKSLDGSEWLGKVEDISVIGDVRTTAQVTPYPMTTFLADKCREAGVQITIALVDGIEFADDGSPRGLRASNEQGETFAFPATDIVFAAGPWTGTLAKKLLGRRAGAAGGIVPSEASTSIIMRPPSDATIPPQALFSSIRMPDGRYGSPEVFPRPDGTVYICGAGTGDGVGLPTRAKEVGPSTRAVERLVEYMNVISPTRFKDATIEVQQACFRPNPPRGGNPVIGQLDKGLWVASGHNVWGLNHGPGTGKCMAELIYEGRARSADISGLAPSTL